MMGSRRRGWRRRVVLCGDFDWSWFLFWEMRFSVEFCYLAFFFFSFPLMFMSADFGDHIYTQDIRTTFYSLTPFFIFALHWNSTINISLWDYRIIVLLVLLGGT
jgi:hypothetical protein